MVLDLSWVKVLIDNLIKKLQSLLLGERKMRICRVLHKILGSSRTTAFKNPSVHGPQVKNCRFGLSNMDMSGYFFWKPGSFSLTPLCPSSPYIQYISESCLMFEIHPHLSASLLLLTVFHQDCGHALFIDFPAVTLASQLP